MRGMHLVRQTSEGGSAFHAVCIEMHVNDCSFKHWEGKGNARCRWGNSRPVSRVVRCRIIAPDCKFACLVACLFDSNENAICGKVPALPQSHSGAWFTSPSLADLAQDCILNDARSGLACRGKRWLLGDLLCFMCSMPFWLQFHIVDALSPLPLRAAVLWCPGIR